MKHNTQLKTLAVVLTSLAAGTLSSTSYAEKDGWYLGSTLSIVDFDDATFSSNEVINGVQSPRNLVVSSESSPALPRM